MVDGGAFNHGSHVAVRMGLKVGCITRLAKEDFHVVDELRQLGADVQAHATPQSTCLRLEYPSLNLDERVIYVTGTADPFVPADVRDVDAEAFVIGTSMRGEVGLDVIEELATKDALIAADVQGFVRVARDGKLAYEAWPEEAATLDLIDVLKTDAVEAEMLTGTGDVHQAAQILASLGPNEIVLTRSEGVLVYADGQYHEAPFYPKQVVGRSGRGDTCVAAYVARRLTASVADATVWSAAVTSLKMEAEGAFHREIREVEALAREFLLGPHRAGELGCGVDGV